MVLPVLALLLAVGLWSVAVAGAQLRCVDAARDGARAAARGESDAVVVAATTAAAPQGAQVDVHHDGSRVVVVVSARVGGGLGRSPRSPHRRSRRRPQQTPRLEP